MKYLSSEEQFAEILNNEEIGRIEDYELRNIRMKYWRMKHEAFQDEHRISDADLGKEYDRIKELEDAEIEEYKVRKGL